MWWLLIKSLGAFLKDRPEFNDEDDPKYVQIGATRKDPTNFPTLILLRFKELGEDIFKQKDGVVFMWLEFWTKNDDPDPSVAYEQLSAFEEMMRPILLEWNKTLVAELGVACKISIPATKGDGDSVRPKCISQMTLQIEWHRSPSRMMGLG